MRNLVHQGLCVSSSVSASKEGCMAGDQEVPPNMAKKSDIIS